MDQEKLPSLINKLEKYSSSHPRRYRMRVMLLAALGYGYLAVIVVGLLSMVYWILSYGKFNFVTIKIIWIPLVLVGLIVRSLWITIPEPDGQPLNPVDAQPLFGLIAEVQNELKGPTVHRVLLSDEFNAGIVQIPRFGMFGWLKNYLVVGLPLLTALGPNQLRSVLAHEFGHLTGKHGGFSGWIYRVRQSWIQILTAVHQERHYASFLFEPFLNWYAPFFNAYSFVLARRQEYEADASAAKLAGRETAARTLVQIALMQRVMADEFWPNFYRGAHDNPQPPKDPFAKLVRHLGQTTSHVKAEIWFLQELRVKTGYDDTHPALADRLAGLGFPSDFLSSREIIDSLVTSQGDSQETAATHYLSNVPEEFVAQSNRAWREQIVQTWRHRHREIERARERLSELEKQSETQTLIPDEQLERAGHLAELYGMQAALNPLKELLMTAPDHAAANIFLGSILLEQDNADGLKYLESAIEHNPAMSGDAWSLIADYHLGHGRLKEADDFSSRAQKYYETAERLNTEALTLSPNDRFEPHGLSEPELSELRKQLAQVRGLCRAYLARKVLPEGTDPLYVLGVLADYTWRDGRNDKHIDALLNDLTTVLRFDRPTIFVSLDGPEHNLLTQFRSLTTSTVFARDGVVEAEIELRH